MTELTDLTAPTAAKAKRVMTPAQLENLSAARVKAMERRQELATITAREKALKDQQLSERISAITKAEKTPSKKRKRTPTTPTPSSSDSGSESDVDSDSGSNDSEPKTKTKTKAATKTKPKPKAKPRVRAPPKPKQDTEMAQQVVRDELQRRFETQNYRHAFAAIFPGQPNIYD